MSLGIMKYSGAAVLCLFVAISVCLAQETTNVAGPNGSAETPTPVSNLTTGSSATATDDTSKNDNLTSSQKELLALPAPTTASRLTISVTAHTTGDFPDNGTGVIERRNDTSTSEHKTSSAPTTASQFTPHKTGNGSSIANETGVIERGDDTSTSVHNTSSAPTTALQLTSPVTDNKTENGSSMTSGSKHGQTPPSLPSGSNIILPVFIPLGIVLFLAVAVVLYKMCKKTPPGDEAQNATEKPTSKNESVKLLSVKTSPEAGEHSSQRRNKTLQNDEDSPHLDHKYV